MRGIAIRVLAGVALGSVVISAAPGCGSRGPLDDGLVFLSADASIDATDDVVSSDAPSDAIGDAPKDAGHDATPIDCVQCLFSQCQDAILTCIQSQPCQQAFQCVAQDCLAGGGGPDPGCILNCASSSPGGALQVFNVFQCVTMQCGPDCSSVLAGLGGLGGGGGGRDR
jgi:hypothetical protein